MSDTEKLRATYDHIAATYTANHLDDTWDDDYREKFCSALPTGVTVLDLGCGPGTDTKLLVDAGLKLTGFDLSDGLLEIARRQNPGTEFVQGDMRKLPFEDGTFDALFAKASLLHIPKADMPGVLKEIKRVVVHGGLVHIAIKGGEGEREVAEQDFERFFSYWDPEAFTQLLEAEQFTLVERAAKHVGHTDWLQYLARTT